MIRSHRLRRLSLWLLLAPLMAAGLLLSLAQRS
jgi:hypothetical protein